VWPPPFEAPDDPSFGPAHKWRRGHEIEPRALTLSDVIDRAFAFYRMHWKALLGFVAILVVPVQFLDEYLRRNFPSVLTVRTGAQPNPNGHEFLISLAILAITLFFVQPLVIGGLTRAVAAFHLGRSP